MPKNEAQLQAETKVPLGYSNIISRETEYPRIISHVTQGSKGKATSPEAIEMEKRPLRENFDPQYGTEENLHTQYVKSELAGPKSTQNFR